MKPQPFGRYLLLDKVASGGMAEVWRGKLTGEGGFQRIVAIKKILPHVCEDADFITMFTDEAKITVQLQHSNIGQVYEFDKVDGLYFISMEYISGKDLKTVWSYQRSRKQTIPLDMACVIIQRMAEGLDYAHRKKDNFGNELGIVHRDVSPQNCLISWDGEVKVIDFGIAKAAEKGGRTRAGTLKGKFAYMSPEQIRGLKLDGRADVFALGVCLYELVTGERGFQAESEFSLLEMVRNVEIKPPTMVNKEIPQELERIIFKALAKDREHRYQHGSDLSEDIQRFLLNRGKPPKPTEIGKYLRENFTVDYDKERLRLESYKEIEWTAPKGQPTPQADNGEAPMPEGNPMPSAPPPQSLSAVQAAMAEEGATDAFPGGSGTFASSGGTASAAAVPARPSGAPVASEVLGSSSSTGYVIAGHREEVTANRTPTHASAMQLTDENLTPLPMDPPPPATKDGSTLLKIAAGLFLMTLLVAGGVGYLLLFGATGTISLTVVGPKDGTVIVDGQQMGVANPSLIIPDIQAGEHDVIVQKENSTFQAWHRKVTVVKGEVATLKAVMVQAAGRLNVSTMPAGAALYLDDGPEPVCEKSPCQVNASGGLTHSITAKKKKFRDETVEVKVAATEAKDLSIELTPEEYTVEVRSIPSGATLFINGKKMGKTPVTFSYSPDDPPPKAKLVSKKRGCKPYESSLSLEKKLEQTLNLSIRCK